jgi:mitochondrial enoyl-[acyl-carrier protein] reductase / trans-2-enoyl-CoA reductase
MIPAGMLIFSDIHFDGFWVSAWSDAHPGEKKYMVDEILQMTRDGKFKDTPVTPIEWSYDTKEDALKDAVQGTLEGFRDGKGVFVFKE